MMFLDIKIQYSADFIKKNYAALMGSPFGWKQK